MIHEQLAKGKGKIGEDVWREPHSKIFSKKIESPESAKGFGGLKGEKSPVASTFTTK